MSRIRKPKDNVLIVCPMGCGWARIGRTWRPVKRKLADHLAAKHQGGR